MLSANSAFWEAVTLAGLVLGVLFVSTVHLKDWWSDSPNKKSRSSSDAQGADPAQETEPAADDETDQSAEEKAEKRRRRKQDKKDAEQQRGGLGRNAGAGPPTPLDLGRTANPANPVGGEAKNRVGFPDAAGNGLPGGSSGGETPATTPGANTPSPGGRAHWKDEGWPGKGIGKDKQYLTQEFELKDGSKAIVKTEMTKDVKTRFIEQTDQDGQGTDTEPPLVRPALDTKVPEVIVPNLTGRRQAPPFPDRRSPKDIKLPNSPETKDGEKQDTTPSPVPQSELLPIPLPPSPDDPNPPRHPIPPVEDKEAPRPVAPPHPGTPPRCPPEPSGEPGSDTESGRQALLARTAPDPDKPLTVGRSVLEYPPGSDTRFSGAHELNGLLDRRQTDSLARQAQQRHDDAGRAASKQNTVQNGHSANTTARDNKNERKTTPDGGPKVPKGTRHAETEKSVDAKSAPRKPNKPDASSDSGGSDSGSASESSTSERLPRTRNENANGQAKSKKDKKKKPSGPPKKVTKSTRKRRDDGSSEEVATTRPSWGGNRDPQGKKDKEKGTDSSGRETGSARESNNGGSGSKGKRKEQKTDRGPSSDDGEAPTAKTSRKVGGAKGQGTKSDMSIDGRNEEDKVKKGRRGRKGRKASAKGVENFDGSSWESDGDEDEDQDSTRAHGRPPPTSRERSARQDPLRRPGRDEDYTGTERFAYFDDDRPKRGPRRAPPGRSHDASGRSGAQTRAPGGDRPTFGDIRSVRDREEGPWEPTRLGRKKTAGDALADGFVPQSRSRNGDGYDAGPSIERHDTLQDGAAGATTRNTQKPQNIVDTAGGNEAVPPGQRLGTKSRVEGPLPGDMGTAAGIAADVRKKRSAKATDDAGAAKAEAPIVEAPGFKRPPGPEVSVATTPRGEEQETEVTHNTLRAARTARALREEKERETEDARVADDLAAAEAAKKGLDAVDPQEKDEAGPGARNDREAVVQTTPASKTALSPGHSPRRDEPVSPKTSLGRSNQTVSPVFPPRPPASVASGRAAFGRQEKSTMKKMGDTKKSIVQLNPHQVPPGSQNHGFAREKDDFGKILGDYVEQTRGNPDSGALIKAWKDFRANSDDAYKSSKYADDDEKAVADRVAEDARLMRAHREERENGLTSPVEHQEKVNRMSDEAYNKAVDRNIVMLSQISAQDAIAAAKEEYGDVYDRGKPFSKVIDGHEEWRQEDVDSLDIARAVLRHFERKRADVAQGAKRLEAKRAEKIDEVPADLPRADKAKGSEHQVSVPSNRSARLAPQATAGSDQRIPPIPPLEWDTVVPRKRKDKTGKIVTGGEEGIDNAAREAGARDPSVHTAGSTDKSGVGEETARSGAHDKGGLDGATRVTKSPANGGKASLNPQDTHHQSRLSRDSQKIHERPVWNRTSSVDPTSDTLRREGEDRKDYITRRIDATISGYRSLDLEDALELAKREQRDAWEAGVRQFGDGDDAEWSEAAEDRQQIAVNVRGYFEGLVEGSTWWSAKRAREWRERRQQEIVKEKGHNVGNRLSPVNHPPVNTVSGTGKRSSSRSPEQERHQRSDMEHEAGVSGQGSTQGEADQIAACDCDEESRIEERRAELRSKTSRRGVLGEDPAPPVKRSSAISGLDSGTRQSLLSSQKTSLSEGEIEEAVAERMKWLTEDESWSFREASKIAAEEHRAALEKAFIHGKPTGQPWTDRLAIASRVHESIGTRQLERRRKEAAATGSAKSVPGQQRREGVSTHINQPRTFRNVKRSPGKKIEVKEQIVSQHTGNNLFLQSLYCIGRIVANAPVASLFCAASSAAIITSTIQIHNFRILLSESGDIVKREELPIDSSILQSWVSKVPGVVENGEDGAFWLLNLWIILGIPFIAASCATAISVADGPKYPGGYAGRMRAVGRRVGRIVRAAWTVPRSLTSCLTAGGEATLMGSHPRTLGALRRGGWRTVLKLAFVLMTATVTCLIGYMVVQAATLASDTPLTPLSQEGTRISVDGLSEVASSLSPNTGFGLIHVFLLIAIPSIVYAIYSLLDPEREEVVRTGPVRTSCWKHMSKFPRRIHRAVPGWIWRIFFVNAILVPVITVACFFEEVLAQTTSIFGVISGGDAITGANIFFGVMTLPAGWAVYTLWDLVMDLWAWIKR